MRRVVAVTRQIKERAVVSCVRVIPDYVDADESFAVSVQDSECKRVCAEFPEFTDAVWNYQILYLSE